MKSWLIAVQEQNNLICVLWVIATGKIDQQLCVYECTSYQLIESENAFNNLYGQIHKRYLYKSSLLKYVEQSHIFASHRSSLWIAIFQLKWKENSTFMRFRKKNLSTNWNNKSIDRNRWIVSTVENKPNSMKWKHRYFYYGIQIYSTAIYVLKIVIMFLSILFYCRSIQHWAIRFYFYFRT